MSNNHLVGEKSGNLYTIALNRPEKRNAITVEMLTGVCELAESQASDPDVRAILLKGEGKIFSAGVDFNSLGTEVGQCLGDSGAGGTALRALIYKFQQFFNRLEAIEIPIICAIHGRVLGLGVEMALACDIRLMTDDCVWGMPELKLGVIADLGGTSRLARLMGPSRTMEVFMTAREYSAQQALEWGLVDHLYPQKDLFEEVARMVHDITTTAPLAVGAMKKVIKRGQGIDLMTQLDMEANLNSILLRTEDFQEGITAMMEGRVPEWKRK